MAERQRRISRDPLGLRRALSDRLLAGALSRDGSDNVSLVLVELG